MSGVTAGGWPYVTPEDHPLEFPALSQQLANKLESSGATAALGALTPSAGWADFGGIYAGLFVTKNGRQVIVDAMLKPTSDIAMTAGGTYNVATVPAAYWPARSVYAPAAYRLSGTVPVAGVIQVTPSGTVSFNPSAAGTITAAAGYVAIALPYRSAT